MYVCGRHHTLTECCYTVALPVNIKEEGVETLVEAKRIMAVNNAAQAEAVSLLQNRDSDVPQHSAIIEECKHYLHQFCLDMFIVFEMTVK